MNYLQRRVPFSYSLFDKALSLDAVTGEGGYKLVEAIHLVITDRPLAELLVIIPSKVFERRSYVRLFRADSWISHARTLRARLVVDI